MHWLCIPLTVYRYIALCWAEPKPNIYIYETRLSKANYSAFRLYIFFSMCVPWESNPQPLPLLMQCSTTEPQEHTIHYIVSYNHGVTENEWVVYRMLSSLLQTHINNYSKNIISLQPVGTLSSVGPWASVSWSPCINAPLAISSVIISITF